MIEPSNYAPEAILKININDEDLQISQARKEMFAYVVQDARSISTSESQMIKNVIVVAKEVQHNQCYETCHVDTFINGPIGFGQSYQRTCT